MNKKINYGEFKGNTYEKYVSFSKAVLWKTREISIHKDVGRKIKIDDDVRFVRFIDRDKGEVWLARKDRVIRSWKLKQEGQEPQFYIPVEVFQTKKEIRESGMRQGKLIDG